jgi:single-strand DNA-binding protein
MNMHSIIGRLTKDPELRFTKNGKAICTVSVAVNRQFDKEQADFFTCEFWGTRGEALAKYTLKGDRIFITGEHQNQRYTDKEGNQKTFTKIVGSNFEFLGVKREQTQQQVEDTKQEKSLTDDLASMDMDDIPFGG